MEQQGSKNNNATCTCGKATCLSKLFPLARCSGTTTASDVNIGPLTGVQMKPLGAVPTEESTGFEDLDEFWEASATTDKSSALEPQGLNNNNSTSVPPAQKDFPSSVDMMSCPAVLLPSARPP